MLDLINFPALWFAFGVLALAIGLAWGFRRYQITDSVGLVAVLVLPFLAYGVASGFIAKVSLPGGFAAEFFKAAAAQVKPTPLAEEVQDLRIIEKAGVAAIRGLQAGLQVGKPIAVSVRLGQVGFYNTQTIAEYIRAFLPFDPDLTVLFVEDLSGRFVASANANSVLAALSVTDPEQLFLRAVEGSDLLALRGLVVLTEQSARADTTNADALAMMVADGVDAIIKTDADGAPSGVVRRDEIMGRLMLKLAAGG